MATLHPAEDTRFGHRLCPELPVPLTEMRGYLVSDTDALLAALILFALQEGQRLPKPSSMAGAASPDRGRRARQPLARVLCLFTPNKGC